MKDTDREVRIGPWYTVTQIAQMCRELSTETVEVYARIEAIEGTPVAYFVRSPRPPAG